MMIPDYNKLAIVWRSQTHFILLFRSPLPRSSRDRAIGPQPPRHPLSFLQKTEIFPSPLLACPENVYFCKDLNQKPIL
ncbi:hypothetical protein [Oxynema aestuarii]|uniref:Uncharacterized protein n=1 Tax=Oxynema aestuarii AP17 TaxID=2064643 RepID=A0A6H1TYM7_9CYAN|nr:hypothetical protein [Oxynema aestuarii]QIZ71718.1 hypothetical protein HCG48_14950 [Oxynema aestuarii AP17]RMH79040.1 MAG: hypothetical protein D6680_00460 [Cyanobacteria bacterium J007]